MPLAADWLHLAAITRRQLHRWPETPRLLTLKIGQTKRRKNLSRNAPSTALQTEPQKCVLSTFLKMCTKLNNYTFPYSWHSFLFEQKRKRQSDINSQYRGPFCGKLWWKCFGSGGGKHKSSKISHHEFLPKMLKSLQIFAQILPNDALQSHKNDIVDLTFAQAFAQNEMKTWNIEQVTICT